MNVEAVAMINQAARDLAQATGETAAVWAFPDDHRETVTGGLDLSSRGGVKVFEARPLDPIVAALSRPRMFR